MYNAVAIADHVYSVVQLGPTQKVDQLRTTKRMQFTKFHLDIVRLG